MSDDKYLYWSCNREKFMKISSSDYFTERLGYKLDTEWYLDIKSIIYTSYKPSESGSLQTNFPIWEFFLRRDKNLTETNVIANFFHKDNSMQHFNLTFKKSQSMISFWKLNFDNSEHISPCFNLILVFKTNNETASTIKKRGLSKLKNLSEDFRSMLDKGNRSDVTLKCDAEVIRAHKNVLGARSPVFEAMFNSNMEENEKDEVVIEDMDPSVLRAMVCFIYSGRIKDLNLEFAKDLLYASEKYQISAMKEGCIEYLQSILSNENALEILEMGDLYDENLKSHVIQYVCNNFNEFKTKEEWRFIKKNKPLLAMEIYSDLEPYIEKNA